MSSSYAAQMLRVRLDKLVPVSGLLTFRGSPFSGIAYRVEGDLVVENFAVSDGVLGSSAEDWDPAVSRVTVDSLFEIECDETDEQHPVPGMYSGDVLFRGVAYEFDANNGCLLSEQTFEKDRPGARRAWYSNGQLSEELDRIGSDGHYECEAWHDNGQRRFLTTMTLSVCYTKLGRLLALGLRPGYSPSILDEQSFLVDSDLLLSGRGIDDQIISRLDGLERLSDLALHGTLITSNGLQRFGVARMLESLDTEENTQFNSEDVQTLLTKLPYCDWIDRDTLLKKLEDEANY